MSDIEIIVGEKAEAEDKPARRKRDNSLEVAIGQQVRHYRHRLDMTVVDLARLASLSAGMLSKIENGATSPSLSTLQSLARALNVPVTELFRSYEEVGGATYVEGGAGPEQDRRGTRHGFRYRYLGHSVAHEIVVEPYMVEIDANAEPNTVFQHTGMELLVMMEGRMRFRHGEQDYELKPGDSLYFDSNAPHGPAAFHQTPIRFLAVMVDSKS